MGETFLVTGGAGFIGSALVRRLSSLGHRAVVLDAFRHPEGRAHLDGVAGGEGCVIIEADVCDPDAVRAALARFGPRTIVHLAAESHVDRSIDDAAPFVHTNVVGTQVLCDATRRHLAELSSAEGARVRLLYVSTDEVLGPAEEGVFLDERAPMRPTSPYAASKAGGELVALAYQRTFGLPVVVARPTNHYGPRQLPEKLVPLVICRALEERSLPVYGDGLQSRDWIYVDDGCDALLTIAAHGAPGAVYHVASGALRTTRDVVGAIAAALDAARPRPGGRSYAELATEVADRPGHDRRYGVDARRARDELGWAPRTSFDDGVRMTVAWYLEHEDYRRAARAHTERRGLGGGGRA